MKVIIEIAVPVSQYENVQLLDADGDMVGLREWADNYGHDYTARMEN